MEDGSKMEVTTWREALRLLLDHIQPLPTAAVELVDARARFLQIDALATADAPAFDVAMMDGYAVGDEASVGQELRIAGTSLPGDPPAEALQVGTTRRIFTGAPTPNLTARVIPQELIQETENEAIRILEVPEARLIRPRGSEASAGDTILSKGQHLGPAELAILASLGIAKPRVGGKPRIAHLVLGGELIDPAQTPVHGQIRDSNSILIHALVEEWNAQIVFHQRLDDDSQKIVRALEESRSLADMILISGGASVGEHDHARSSLAKVGFKFLFEKTDLRPGRPAAAAVHKNQTAICLPGNPLAHLVVFHLLVRPALSKLSGATIFGNAFHSARLAQCLTGKANSRHTFWPAVLLPDGLHPLRFLTSGDVLSLVGANALISLEPGAPLPGTGENVSFLPLNMP